MTKNKIEEKTFINGKEINLDNVNWMVAYYPNFIGKQKKLVGELVLYNRFISREDLGIEPITTIRVPVGFAFEQKNLLKIKRIFKQIKKIWNKEFNEKK